MAHELEIINGKASMAFAGKTPWHGLGTPLQEEDLYDWTKASAKAGLNWDAELVPLVTTDREEKVAHRAVRRSSDGKLLGVVGPRYAILQNQDAFRWFEPFLKAKEAALHTCGSLRGGSRIWVLAKLNRDPLVIAPGDEVEKFLMLSHSHDGSLAVRVGFTPIRVVCANTLSVAHGAVASKLLRVKHTKDVQQNLENIREVINVANAAFQATAEQFRLLARKSINQADLRRYVQKVFQVEDEKKAGPRMLNVMEEVCRLAEEGRGNDLPSVRGTLWTAYNGVSEWLSYERGRNIDNRLNSLWFGDGANLNRQALQAALEMAV